MAIVRYVVSSELPDLEVTWRDSSGAVINFTSGWTFSLRIGAVPVVEKNAGITGSSVAPNVLVSWAADELDGIEPGNHSSQLWARRTSDNKDRVLPFTLQLVPAIVPA